MKVLIPQPIPEDGVQFLRSKGYEVVMGTGFDVESLKREIVDADAVLARTALYPAEVIEAGNRLRVSARFGVGTDNIDSKRAEELGIYVTIAKNGNACSVAEHTIALMLACAKLLFPGHAAVSAGDWEFRNRRHPLELSGKTLGIIGVGSIGSRVANKAHYGFDMEIVGYDPYVDRSALPSHIQMMDSLEELLERSDVVSVHTPSNEETRGMIGAEAFRRMKSHAILINCARGGIVDEDALYRALREGDIASAGMDVFREEPAPADHPLFTLPNFIASPHIAALTGDANRVTGLLAVESIDDVLSGRTPKYPINSPKIG